jgi:hypothetical protein
MFVQLSDQEKSENCHEDEVDDQLDEGSPTLTLKSEHAREKKKNS